MVPDYMKNADYDGLLSIMTDTTPLTGLPTSPMEFVPPSPPPPPLPHHLRGRPSQVHPGPNKPSVMVQKFQGMPPDWLTTGYTLDDQMDDHIASDPFEFRRVHYFFYGTLKDHKVLSHILERDIKPVALQPAQVIGYSCEMWGCYKALVDGPMGAIVEGVAYKVESEEDETRLAAYETDAYETYSCLIDLQGDGEGSSPHTITGKTFMYAGDPDALREKRFDRKLWVKNMAPELRFKF